MSAATRLVADVGGTNTRIALFDPGEGRLRALTTYVNRDYRAFEDTVAAWLEALQEPAPRLGCIAVAAPPGGDRITMSNIDWSFSCTALATRFGFQTLKCINDFESNAFALPHLTAADLAELKPGSPPNRGRLATLGPGTGLGGAVLDWAADCAPRAHACEPGHAGLSPASELELQLFSLLLPRHGNVYAELLVSGPGLQRLYASLAELHGAPVQPLLAADISRRALSGEDELCQLALDTFCALLGSACGDFLLATGSYDGLYLAGGILPGMIPYLQASDFQQRLQEKGAMRQLLAAVPVFVITAAYPGLIGAAHAPI